MAEPSEVLPPTEVARLLRLTTATLDPLRATVPSALHGWHPLPGEWCIKEVVGHLIEAEERGFAGRIRIILGEKDPALKSWDQEEVARLRADCGRDPGDLLGEFRTLRAASIELVNGLGRVDLERGGHHPLVGYLTVGELLQEWAFHDQNHLRQILANLQAFVWPHMGSAQRFYS